MLICVIFWSINSFPSWTMWRARRGVMRAHHAPWRSTCSDFLCRGRPASLIGKSVWGKHLTIESRCQIYQVSSLNETRRDEGAVTMFGNYATNWNGSQLDTRPRVGQQTVCLNDLYSMFLRVDAVSRIGDNLIFHQSVFHAIPCPRRSTTSTKQTATIMSVLTPIVVGAFQHARPWVQFPINARATLDGWHQLDIRYCCDSKRFVHL